MELLRERDFYKNQFAYNQRGYYHIPSVKFIHYGKVYFVIVTLENQVFIYKQFNEYYYSNNYYKLPCQYKIEKLEHSFGNIKHLYCCNDRFIIVNDKNIIYSIQIFRFHVSEINTFLTEKEIKFVRSTNSIVYFVTTNNNLFNLQKTLQLQLNINIKDLQCGSYHSIILDTNGLIYGDPNNLCSNNTYYTTSEKYDLIGLPFKAVQISCIKEGTFILNEFNELFASGKNTNGELGLGHKNVVNSFTKIVIKGVDRIKMINSNFCSNNLLILTKHNSVYILGKENKGILKSKRKFIYPFLVEDEVFILASDYKVNDDSNIIKEEEFNIKLGQKCFLKLNKEICDIDIIVNYNFD
ncbi:hypothetical protein ABK040_007698 [Willaertia magna]